MLFRSVLVHPAAATLDDSYDQIEELGKATGHRKEAAAVVSEMREHIKKISDDVTGRGSAQVLSVYHELDATFFSASSSTFIGELYGMLGLENIADEADTAKTGGYPQLSPEYIITADPDLIVITDEGGYAPQDVAARPGWQAISAVAKGNVMQVDADLSSRWGPRVVDFLQLVADRVSEMQGA